MEAYLWVYKDCILGIDGGLEWQVEGAEDHQIPLLGLEGR